MHLEAEDTYYLLPIDPHSGLVIKTLQPSGQIRMLHLRVGRLLECLRVCIYEGQVQNVGS